MHTIKTEVIVNQDHILIIPLPEDIAVGTYQVEIKMDFQPEVKSVHQINELAGKVKAFQNIDSLTWQQQIRSEWDETRLFDRH